MKKFNQLLLTISLFSFANISSATLIEGTINFGGSVDFDFTTNDVTINNAIVVTAPTLDFAGFASIGDTAVYNDFNYSPLSVDGSAELWSVGGLDFTLTEITYIDESTDGGVDFLDLHGNGIFSDGVGGFDDTEGFWSFSTDGLEGNFTFSSTNVPEPGVALLLSVGLIGFGVSRKLRKTA